MLELLAAHLNGLAFGLKQQRLQLLQEELRCIGKLQGPLIKYQSKRQEISMFKQVLLQLLLQPLGQILILVHLPQISSQCKEVFNQRLLCSLAHRGLGTLILLTSYMSSSINIFQSMDISKLISQLQSKLKEVNQQAMFMSLLHPVLT